MSNAITEGTRKFLAQRAEYCCEYCRFPEYYSFWSFQVDHIISLKHGGDSSLENLAWSCFPCNNHKGRYGGFLATKAQLRGIFF